MVLLTSKRVATAAVVLSQSLALAQSSGRKFLHLKTFQANNRSNCC